MDKIENIDTCFLSTFPPRGCGIASFTKDLSTAMDKRFNPKLKSKVIAINNEEDYNYPDKVLMKIEKENLLDHIKIAKKINESENIKIVCVQHEFGLFGGDYGCYLIPFLDALEKPCVVTFHTVLPNPDEDRKKIVQEIALRCSAMIVIAEKAIDILNKDYDIEKEKLHLVHHGIPNVKFQDSSIYKEKLGLKNKTVLCTHGLLSRGKGLEYSIKALPDLIKNYPNLVYLIVGQVHPGACYEDGEKYKKELEKLIKNLNLNKHVRFVNRYVTLKELIEYILACDVYVFTNLEKDQISSGTIVRALGCGRAVVSTPITYSKEILTDNRGVLVKFKNPKSFTEGIDKILSNPKLKEELEKNAYFHTRQMTWSNVALSYLKIFNKVVLLRKEITEKFPEIKLDHLKNLTDDLGIIQFAKHTSPHRESGYTLDDNSRALIFSCLHNRFFNSSDSLRLSKVYLNFIESVQEDNGNFKNQHKNKEEKTNPYSEDSFGRTLWALGFIINKSKDYKILEKAKLTFNLSLEYLSNINSPRAKAFSLIGLCYYYQTYESKSIFVKIKELANDLINLYKENSSEDWVWFEPYLTYANAKLPEALFLAHEATGDLRYLEVAKKTLNFLLDLSIINDKLYPIGEKGWYNRDDKRAFFDQQPIDASSTVQACLTALEITGNRGYYDKAVISFNWFLGHNHLNQMIYDEATGGCFDGLGEHSLNYNQGAESTIEYLIARVLFEGLEERIS